MTIGGRIEERLHAIGMSQAELARRVGVRQSTINGLIRGGSRSSAHLHLIARELNTTPAYLTGETDDPESGVPDPPAFSHEDVEILERLALLSDRARDALLVLIDECTAAPGRTVHSTRRGYRAQSQGGA